MLKAFSREAVRLMAWYKSSFFTTYSAGIFLGFGLYTLYFYSELHWEVIQFNYDQIDMGLQNSLFSLLDDLESYRVIGLVAFIFSLWGCFLRPRWLLPLNLIIGAASCFLMVVTM